MNYISLFYSISLAVGAFSYYHIHKWWLNGRDENPIYFKPSTKIGIIKNWIIIISLLILSLVFLLKSF
jgi:hypothetical protein